jgi:hypothetical protein
MMPFKPLAGLIMSSMRLLTLFLSRTAAAPAGQQQQPQPAAGALNASQRYLLERCIEGAVS